MTQQINEFVQSKNQKNQLRNKIFNFNKNLVYDNNKKLSIEIPTLSGKKIVTTSNDDNSIIKNNNYRSKFINKKLLNNKTNISNSYFLNNSIINKSKKIKLNKNIIYKPKLKGHNLSKNKQADGSLINNDVSINKSNIPKNLNNISNNSYLLKKYESIIKNKPQKKNLNINININNNNKIIYNRVFDNKSPLIRNNYKIIKSPILKKIGTYINNTSFGNPGNLVINKKGKKSSGKINLNNLKKNNEKLKFNDVQFPKAKLLNIYQRNNII
jgi:hypothetical protein